MGKNVMIVALLAVVLVAGYLMYQGRSVEITVEDNPPQDTNPPPKDSEPKVAASPLAVTSSRAVPTDTTVVLTGNITPNGAFTSYWYEYGTSMSMGAKTPAQNIGSGFVAIPAPVYITGLAKNTTYYYRLVADNALGRSTGASYSFVTTQGNPPPTGSAPISRTLSASGITKTSANINGEVTPNKSPTQFWFEWGQTANLGNTSSFSSVGDGTSAVSASIAISDLEPLTTYYFRLNAQNQFGTVSGTILNFKTLGPAAAVSAPSVTTGNASNIDENSATLRGSINPNGAVTNYWFEYSTDSLLGSVLIKRTVEQGAGSGRSNMAVSADISDLASETTYYYRLVAQNSEGTVRGDRQSFKTK